MIRISKLTDYAIILLGYMAQAPDRIHASGELSVSAHLGTATVSKILKLLARDAILISVRGARGGYRLAQPPEQITLACIIQSLEGPIALTECGSDQTCCEQASTCHVRGNWSILSRAIRTALEAVTLADMARPMKQAPEAFLIPFDRLSRQAERSSTE